MSNQVDYKVKTDVAALNVAPDFPFLAQHPELCYLDSAATTQQPHSVIDAQREFAQSGYGPVRRAVHDLGTIATAAYENARATVARFISARPSEIIFTQNATAALNLAAWLERGRITAGDEILLTTAEHHSNLLPWQRLACATGAKLVWAEVHGGTIESAEITQKITPRTKVVALTHLSNVLGSVVPATEIVAAAHTVGAHVVIDAAQSIGRLPVNFQALGADYLVFSGHKMYGPTGIGVLVAREKLLTGAEPLFLGGGMVGSVTRNDATWLDGPARFEGGTPPVTQAVGLSAAITYLEQLGLENVWQHDQVIGQYLNARLQELPFVKKFSGKFVPHAAIAAWQVEMNGNTIHSHDVATILNQRHVAIRAGHHCAQVLLEALGVQDLCRASGGVYSTTKDVDALISGLGEVYEVFGQATKKWAATVPSH